MPKKDLIYIGQRSKLLKLLYPLLPKGEIISFNNAFNFHLKNKLKDKKLILFSLPEEDNIKEYFSFIKEVNCKFLINISSTCIFADAYFKDKIFNKIPKYLFIKAEAHKFISLRSNSKNLIIGILNGKAPFPSYPFSKIELIAEDLENLINNFELIKVNDYYSLKIISPKLSKFRFIPYNFRVLIRNLDFGIPLIFDFIYKFLNLKARNYTCLSCFHFIDNLRVGDGTFGTAASSKNEIIFYSGRNTIKSSKESLNTLIGYEKIGLDKYRHGVKTFYKNGDIFKQWFFTPRIRSVLRKAYKYHVSNISWNEENQFFEIIAKNGSKKIKFFSNSLKLAAGTLENIKLTLCIARNFNFNKIKLSDHFITCIGNAKFEEILKKKYFLKTIIPFVYKRNNLIPIFDKRKIIGFAEFRIDTKSNIKLLVSLKKIISYFFNRTGYMIFKPISCEIWVQLLTEDLLGIEIKDDFEKSISLVDLIDTPIDKTRDNLVNLSKMKLSEILKSFKNQINPYLPAHHLWGGGEILESSIIAELIKKEKLNIYGSPSILKLGPFHHTIRNVKIIKSKLNKLPKKNNRTG